jgi:predicted nucleic acid-binding protein
VTRDGATAVVVNDASCLIDLRKGQLLHVLVQLPYRLIIPLPVRASELISFTPQEWALLDANVSVYDLTPTQVTEALAIKASYPRLSVNDCFCLITAQHHENTILLTGDGQLRAVASASGQRVHGVLWVLDELKRHAICGDDILAVAAECWRDDPTVRLPPHELEGRLQQYRGK